MANIYEYQGQEYEIDTDDPALAKQKILKYIEANKPQPEKTTLEKFTEPLKSMSVEDWKKSSYLGSRLNFLKSMMPGTSESETQKAIENANQFTTNIVEGVKSAVTNPAQTAQNIYTSVTERPAETAGEMVKGLIYDPEMIPGAVSGTVGAAKTAGNVAAAPFRFGKGFARGLAYPEGTAPNSALAPIRPTYVPHEQVAEFMAGKRPASSLTEVPVAPLYENKPIANWAYGMAPENAAGQKLVPFKGRTVEGIGEQIGGQYRTKPVTAAIDLAATLATGVPAPLTAAARAVPAAAATALQKATQFEPKFGPARAAALARESQVPQPTAGPVAPPVMNMGRVEPTLNAPVTPTTKAKTPSEISQQVAASKLAPQTPIAPTPEPTTKTKAPKNVSKMMTDDEGATFNSLKLPDNAPEVERSIALMKQTDRDMLQKQLESFMRSNDPEYLRYKTLFDKYRIK